MYWIYVLTQEYYDKTLWDDYLLTPFCLDMEIDDIVFIYIKKKGFIKICKLTSEQIKNNGDKRGYIDKYLNRFYVMITKIKTLDEPVRYGKIHCSMSVKATLYGCVKFNKIKDEIGIDIYDKLIEY